MENEFPELLTPPRKSRTPLIIGIVIAVHIVLIGSAFIIQEFKKKSGETVASEETGFPVPMPERNPEEMVRNEAPPMIAESAPREHRAPAAQKTVKPAAETVSLKYVVGKGDTLSGIAVKTGVPIAQLAKDNGLENKKFIRVGQKLVINVPADSQAAIRLAAQQAAKTSAPAKASSRPETLPKVKTSVQIALYKVKRGDNLHTIAGRHGMSLAGLKRLNGLKSDKILVGQQLKVAKAPARTVKQASLVSSIPSVSYEIQKGDNLTSIAARHAMTVGDLRKLNGLETDRIVVGKQLKVLQPGAKPSVQSLLADVQPRDSAPIIHEVRKGETISEIARRYGVSTREVIQVNAIADPTKVPVGERLKIPAVPEQTMPTMEPTVAKL